jgi:hypothetical protein
MIFRLNNYMKVNLTITKENINSGIRAMPGACPIANSITESVNNITYVSVLPYDATIKVKKGNKLEAYRAIMPKIGNNFVKKFDMGADVAPFKLNINFKKISLDQVGLY